jgi:D-3-phosphoglycerate dehydrogenase
MPKVLVSDPISDAGVEIMRKVAEVDVRTGLAKEELIAIIGDYDALAVRSETKVTADVLAAAKKLRIIGRAGVGVDNIDVPGATAAGIVVVNSPEGNTIAAAELTMAMLLALARSIPQADAGMRAGKWERKKFMGMELRAKTLGVVGLGKIGGEVARRARAFDMNVIAYDPFATEERANDYGATLASLDQIYRESDIITVHVPLNDQTRNMISTDQLAIMKDGVRIINCARGGVVDEAALAEALNSGKVGGAAFDVFTKEPIDPENPLNGIANCILTPHLGASTEEAQVLVAIDIAEQIADVLRGKPARSAVNLPSVSADALERAKPYTELAEKLGKLIGQLSVDMNGVGTPIEAVEVKFEGDFTGIPTGAVTRAALVGLLTPVLSDPVNLVNAPGLAKSRGIQVTESQSDHLGECQKLRTNAQRIWCGSRFG